MCCGLCFQVWYQLVDVSTPFLMSRGGEVSVRESCPRWLSCLTSLSLTLGLAPNCLLARCRGPRPLGPLVYPGGRYRNPVVLRRKVTSCGICAVAKLVSWCGGGSEGSGGVCAGKRSLRAASRWGHSTRRWLPWPFGPHVAG